MTAFTIAHGAGGLWHRHRWNGGLILNVQDAVDGDGHLTHEGYEIEDLTGLHSLPQKQIAHTKRPGRIGATRRPVSPDGQPVVYSGLLFTPLPLRGAAMRTALIAAFAANDGWGYMDILPHPDVGGPVGRFYAEVMQLDVPEEITTERFERDFTLGLQLPDPRVYFSELAVSVTGSPAVVTNPGTAPVDPNLLVSGVDGDVTVSDGTHTLSFRNVPAGDLAIDFAARSARVGSTRVELNVPDSDWWDSFQYGIQPGDSTISQTGGDDVTVEFTPAVWA